MNKLFFAFCLFAVAACGTSGKISLTFEQPIPRTQYFDDQTVEVKLNLKGKADSITLILNNSYALPLQENRVKIEAEKLLLGENILVARAYKAGKSIAKKYLLFEVATKHIPQIWKPKVLREIKHENDAFTQGLFLHNDKLYETTGERGHSRLMIRNLEDGKVLKTVKILDMYFGEGATVINNKVYYITWTSGKGFVFDAETLRELGNFHYGKYSKEGWGLTTINDKLVMSNGSDKLLFFDPETMQLGKTLSVVSNRGKQTRLNELEYDGTYIYANVWMTNEIMVISPRTGRVEAIIDCTDLVTQEKNAQKNPDSDVLNGIAYSLESKTFYLTGKNWEHTYEVTLEK